MSCAVEKAKGWAIGMLAAAVALAVFALGIGWAVKLAYHKPGPATRVCARGHDRVNGNYTMFVCDEWVPVAVPSPEATP